MSKKVRIIILVVVALLITLIGIVMFTGIGGEIRAFLHYRLTIPKEIVTVAPEKRIKVTYTYNMQQESFSIDVTDQELIKMIKEISNKKLNNYSSQIGLLIMGRYTVDLGNEISFQFDNYDDDGFVLMHDKDKRFLTKINPEILNKVVSIVDVKLTENIEMFRTNKITVTKRTMKADKVSVLNEDKLDITEKTAIEYILNQCKNIYTKPIDYMPSIVAPDYELDFNNNIKLLVYEEKEKGWILKDGILSEAYELNVFDTILENAFKDIKQKKQMFTADKITITSPNKTVEITNKDIIERITTPIIYSNISRPDWIKSYNITEEYDSGIKIKINDNEFLIPGIKIIGNRYVIDKDKKISLCFPLEDIEQYVNELLGNKTKEATGLVTIGI